VTAGACSLSWRGHRVRWRSRGSGRGRVEHAVSAPGAVSGCSCRALAQQAAGAVGARCPQSFAGAQNPHHRRGEDGRWVPSTEQVIRGGGAPCGAVAAPPLYFPKPSLAGLPAPRSRRALVAHCVCGPVPACVQRAAVAGEAGTWVGALPVPRGPAGAEGGVMMQSGKAVGWRVGGSSEPCTWRGGGRRIRGRGELGHLLMDGRGV
jgi:hypothetical protein